MEFGNRLKKLGLSFGFHLLAPFPGTEVRENSEQYEIKILSDDWSQYHANRAIVETPSVDRRTLDEIVVKWEHEYNDYLAGIKARMGIKEATKAEIWEIENLERIVLLYDLMMENAIEQKGFWSHEGRPVSLQDNLKTLTDRISSSVDTGSEMLFDALDHALKQGNLKCTDLNGDIRWQWVDFLN
jgi:hypothetical protein